MPIQPFIFVGLGGTGGKTLGVVGESGCGKSVTVQAILQLIPMPPGRITSGSAKLNGKEMIGLSPKDINTIRGREIGVIFQDPMSSLNPTMKIGKQIAETVKVHQHASNDEAMQKAIALLEKTKIPEAAKRAQQYPFEFSGGMLQRAMLGLALLSRPKLLIADEPTTALDVTIAAQILELVLRLADDRLALCIGDVVGKGMPAINYLQALVSFREQDFDRAAEELQILLRAAPGNVLVLDGGMTQVLLRDRVHVMPGRRAFQHVGFQHGVVLGAT